MTNEHLAALSDAATPGEWGTDCADHDQPYLDIKIKSGHRNIATVWIDDAPVPDYNQMQKANAALIVALVNAYRANQIAVIGPDAVATVVRELDRAIEYIMGIEIKAMAGDNLAVLLCSQFDRDDDSELDDNGWSQSATDAYDEIKREIAGLFVPVRAAIAAITGRV